MVQLRTPSSTNTALVKGTKTLQQEQWVAVRQVDTVVNYRRQFIKFAAPLDQVPERILMERFLHGLKDDIKAEVRQMGPMTLDQGIKPWITHHELRRRSE